MALQTKLASLLKFSITLLLLGSSLLMANRTANDELISKILQAADLRNANAPEIQSGLISNQITVQKQAILALGRIGDPKTIKSLSAFLYSPQPEIRALTAYALAISENNRAVPFLINRLKTEKSANVIAEILPAIGLLGPSDDSPDIIAVILRYLDDESKQVVSASCDALTYA
ncbi:MAG: HEAT repeat domain-containing protein, partial [Enterobacterales bacterium]|nr:HEAT repeat domain-containing protein [Enterobacterales bacterium]